MALSGLEKCKLDKFLKQLCFIYFYRDPVESMMPLEHHFLRTAAAGPLRLFSELDMDNNNLMNSIEKVRMLQQWSSAVAQGYPGRGPPQGPGDHSQSSLHHLLAAANNAAAAAAAASVPSSLPQLYTLNPTRGSPSPLPLPAHLWSQWTALSQLPPGMLGQHPGPPHMQQGGPPPQSSQHQQPQQHHHGSMGSPTGSGGNGGRSNARSPINLRYSPYPSQASTKAASTSPNAGSIPPNMMNDNVGISMGMGGGNRS